MAEIAPQDVTTLVDKTIVRFPAVAYGLSAQTFAAILSGTLTVAPFTGGPIINYNLPLIKAVDSIVVRHAMTVLLSISNTFGGNPVLMDSTYKGWSATGANSVLYDGVPKQQQVSAGYEDIAMQNKSLRKVSMTGFSIVYTVAPTNIWMGDFTPTGVLNQVFAMDNQNPLHGIIVSHQLYVTLSQKAQRVG